MTIQSSTKMLALFRKTPGVVVTYEKLWEEVWGYTEFLKSRDYSLLKSTVSQTRKLLEAEEFIVSVPGIGYALVQEEGLE